MSVQSLYTAATGMESLQTKLNVIANNLANVNTTGFKSDRANFEDLFYRNEILPAPRTPAATSRPPARRSAWACGCRARRPTFSQGAFQETGQQLDLAIEGKGFLQVTDPVTAQPLYTRAGNLSLNAAGQLVVGSAQTGRLVDPGDHDSARRHRHHDLVRRPGVRISSRATRSSSRPASFNWPSFRIPKAC